MGREREIGDLLNSLVSGLRRDMERHADELAVGRHEWAVLRHLHDDALEGSPSTLDGLWSRMEMSRDHLWQTLGTLEDRGLVLRGRGGWVLTRDGTRKAVPLASIGESIMLKGTSGLTTSEMDELAVMLRRMCANLGRACDMPEGP